MRCQRARGILWRWRENNKRIPAEDTRRSQVLPWHGSAEDVDRFHEKPVFFLDSDYDHIRSRNFVENLLKRNKEWLFRFVIDPDVESTNNRAERALRPSVIYRKVSGGTRSTRGSEAYARLHSIFYTTKLRKKNILKEVPDRLNRKDPHPGWWVHSTDQLLKNNYGDYLLL